MPGATPLLRREVIEALRAGVVPRRGLEQYAVGTDRFEKALAEELDAVTAGRGVFKALRGDFGCGKTFMARWFQQQALARGLAVAEIRISENDTPLHRLETVYRRALESLRTREWSTGAFRSLLESWFFTLEEEVISGGADPTDTAAIAGGVSQLLEGRLTEVSATQPQFAAALRACHSARVNGDPATAEGLMAWLMGQPNVGAAVKRSAGVKGDVDHTGALGFLRGLLAVLRQTSRNGLMLVLDEVETIQRVRADSRERSLNALRQLIDEVHSHSFPGLYLLITGTPAFFDGAHGVRRLPPLEQRLHVDFSGDPRFDSTRAIQVRLLPFAHETLVEVGRKVRDLYPGEAPKRISERVPDRVIESLARAVTGALGGRTGIAPRLFLRKLVSEILDRVDEHPDFDPARHHKLVLTESEMSVEERAAARGEHPLGLDDIALEDTE